MDRMVEWLIDAAGWMLAAFICLAGGVAAVMAAGWLFRTVVVPLWNLL